MVETMTMVFTSLILIQFFKAYNFRSDKQSVFHRIFANHWLNRAVSWEFLLLLLVINLPWLQKPFQTTTMSLVDWGIILGASLTIVPVLEGFKWYLRKKEI